MQFSFRIAKKTATTFYLSVNRQKDAIINQRFLHIVVKVEFGSFRTYVRFSALQYNIELLCFNCMLKDIEYFSFRCQVIEHNPQLKVRGQKTLWNFLKGIREPEITSINRIKAEVDRFYENWISLMDKYKFKPTRIFKTDETGITTVHKSTKIIAGKELKELVL